MVASKKKGLWNEGLWNEGLIIPKKISSVFPYPKNFAQKIVQLSV